MTATYNLLHYTHTHCAMLGNRVFRISSVLREERVRLFSTVFLNDYRPKWPHPDFNLAPTEPKPTLPSQTIPEEKLRFHMAAAMEKGTSIFYSHLQSHPGTLRVRLYVSTVTSIFSFTYACKLLTDLDNMYVLGEG